MDVEPLAALKSGDGWDFRYNKEPKCPHCAHDCRISHNEWWQLYEEGEQQVECPICDHEFTVSTSVEYRFSTDEQGDEL